MLIKARKILNEDPSDLYKLIYGSEITVEFDDDAVTMSATEVILSSYFWVFNKIYPGLSLTKDMVISAAYKGGHFVPSTPNTLFNTVLWKTVDYLGVELTREGLYDLVKIITEVNNKIYNDSNYWCASSVKSLDVLDLIAANDSPEFEALRKDTKEKTNNSPAGIADAFKEAGAIMLGGLREKSGKLNTLSWYSRHGLIKTNQALQSVFVRGYVPDISRESIPHCLENSLLDGMKTPEDFAILGREGSIAVASAKSDLSTMSYAGRRLSFGARYMRYIESTDCQTDKYLVWKVSPAVTTADGMEISSSDLNFLSGKNYLKDDGTLGVLTKKDTHLEGKLVKLRSPLYCKHPNTQTVCSTCYGRLNEAIAPLTGVGRNAAITVSADPFQKQMSIKHHMGSMNEEGDALGANKFLKVRGGNFLLTSINGVKKYTITIGDREMTNISDIFYVENIRDLPIAKITAIEHVLFNITRAHKSIEELIKVGDSKSPVMLSYELLDFIRLNKHLMSYQDNSYTIDITEFNIKSPIFSRTIKMASFIDHGTRIISTFERKGPNITPATEHDINGTLNLIMELMNQGSGNINIVNAEIILAAYIVHENDFKIARAWEPGARLAVGDQMIAERSLSTQLLYMKQAETLEKPTGFLNRSREHSSFDVFIAPKEVVARERRENRK